MLVRKRVRRWQDDAFIKTGNIRHWSISNRLKKTHRISEEFEIMLNSVSLEEIIGLKLELASRALGGKIYALPIWDAIMNIARDALIKYAFSCARTPVEARKFLGIKWYKFARLLHVFNVENYFCPLAKSRNYTKATIRRIQHKDVTVYKVTKEMQDQPEDNKGE